MRSTAQAGFNCAGVQQLALEADDKLLVAANCVRDRAHEQRTQLSTTLGPNVALKPEKAYTFTLGLVFQPQEGMLEKLRTSVDYYHIKLEDALIQPDANLYVADCYNFYGRNPSFDPNYINCQGLFRAGDILGVGNPLTRNTDGFFQFQNDGKIETDGIDVQLTCRHGRRWARSRRTCCSTTS